MPSTRPTTSSAPTRSSPPCWRTLDVQIDCYERHNRYLIPFGCVSTHIKDGGIITEELKDFMRLNLLDPDSYAGDGLGVRRAVQLNWRKIAGGMGFDFGDLNDDQLSDDYHYLIFPNITMNIHCNSVMVFPPGARTKPTPTGCTTTCRTTPVSGRPGAAAKAAASAVQARGGVHRRSAGPGRLQLGDGAGRDELGRLPGAVDLQPGAAHPSLPQGPLTTTCSATPSSGCSGQ